MIKKHRFILALCFAPLVAAALAFGGRCAWDLWLGSVPQLQCPRTLDLGERERGDIAIGRFQIKNAGRGTLTAYDFATSCTCAGVERDTNGRLVHVGSVQLLPGEQIDLLVRVGVAALPGENQLVNVLFATNDPDHSRWQMDVLISRVAGGYIAEPSAVVFGAIPLGERSAQVISLYDNGAADRAVGEVRSSHPTQFTVRLLPLSDEERHKSHPSAGKLFARLRVEAHSQSAGRIDGEIQISLGGEKRSALPIPVLGKVVGVAEACPSTLVLPRYAGNHVERTGEVLIVNRGQKPIEVDVDSVPPEISAKIRVIANHPDRRLLEVEWQPSDKGSNRLSAVSIRLRVRCESEETTLEVPVLLKEDRPL